MSTTQVRVVGAGVAFVLIFFSGIWVSMAGKPYSTLPFTVHKLVGLTLGVLLGVIAYQTHQVAPLGPGQIAAIAVTVLLFVATVAAGGVLSVVEDVPAVALRLHQIVPVLTVLSTAGTLYLLLSGR
jgi:heme A synthase